MENDKNCFNNIKLFESELVSVIKERRKNLKLTQTEISKITGINQRIISLLELGKLKFTFEYLIKYSYALKINFIDFIKIALKRCQNKTKNNSLSKEEQLKEIFIKYNIKEEDIKFLLNLTQPLP